MLSVFKYRIAMQIPNTNAEIMLPKLCRDPNNNEEIKTANIVGVTNLNLDNKTPLNTNSSEIGEIITVETNTPMTGREPVIDIEGTWKFNKKFKPGKYLTSPPDKYNIPYEKKILVNTINKIYLTWIFEKTLETSWLKSPNESLNLKMK